MISKIRSLPESQRKIIVWVVVALVGVILFSWWGMGLGKQFNSFKNSIFEIPQEAKEQIGDLNIYGD